LSDVTKELQNQGLGFMQIMMVLPFLLPYAVRTATQGALLFAVCTVYGRMAATNEVVAVKSMGISPMKLVWPTVWLVAIPLSLLCVLLDDLGATWGATGIDYVIVNSTDEVAYSMLRTHRSFSKKHFAIAVKGVEGRTLIRPTLTYEPPGESHVVTITAQDGELRVDPQTSRLSIIMRSGRLFVPNKVEMSFEDSIEQTLPLDTSLHRAITPTLIGEQRARIASLRKNLAEKKPRTLADRNAAYLYQTAVQRIHTEERYLAWMQTKFHQKWANSFCCLAFVTIGIPVAVQMRRGDFLTSFVICFLPIVSAYQPLQFVGASLAQAGEVPAYAVWFGNVILFAIGVKLLQRMEKH
jgi:lipopolysaccharide export system permease protein